MIRRIFLNKGLLEDLGTGRVFELFQFEGVDPVEQAKTLPHTPMPLFTIEIFLICSHL